MKPKKTERVNKIVEIPLHPSVAALLHDLKRKRGEGFLFPDEQSLHAQDPSRITSVIQQLFEDCGIKTTEEIGEAHRRRAIVRVGFHSLRHTFVSMCAKAGAPLHVVQKLVGHGNPILTSDKYLHLDLEDKQAAIKGLPSFGLDAKKKRRRRKGRRENAKRNERGHGCNPEDAAPSESGCRYGLESKDLPADRGTYQPIGD